MNEFEKTLLNPKSFWLGPILAAHEVGRFGILEYAETDFNANKAQTGEILFSAFVDGKSTNSSYPSLESALVGCIAIVGLGEPNKSRWATTFASQILGL